MEGVEVIKAVLTQPVRARLTAAHEAAYTGHRPCWMKDLKLIIKLVRPKTVSVKGSNSISTLPFQNYSIGGLFDK